MQTVYETSCEDREYECCEVAGVPNVDEATGADYERWYRAHIATWLTSTRPVALYTDAPEAYDGFGTVRFRT